jgi:hypothetical protein
VLFFLTRGQSGQRLCPLHRPAAKITTNFRPNFKHENGKKNYHYGSEGRGIFTAQHLCSLNFPAIPEYIAIWQSRQVSCQLDNIEGATCPRTYRVEPKLKKKKTDQLYGPPYTWYIYHNEVYFTTKH